MTHEPYVTYYMIFFIYGTDHYRVSQKLKELKQGFITKRDKSGFNVVSLDKTDIDFDQLRQEIMATPFLSERKMVVIKNILSNKDKLISNHLAEFLQDKQKKVDNILCLVEYFDPEKIKLGRDKKIEFKNKLFQLLKKEKFVWEFNLLSNWEIENWIKDYAVKNAIKLNPKAAKKLNLAVGNDLAQIVLELDKLRAYCHNKIIGESEVAELVVMNWQENIFELVDAVASRNYSVAHQLFERELVAGNHPAMILGMVLRQFRIILKVKQPDATPTSVSIHPFVFKKALQQSKNFDIKALIKIYDLLLDVEKKIKLNENQSRLIFNLFLTKI